MFTVKLILRDEKGDRLQSISMTSGDIDTVLLFIKNHTDRKTYETLAGIKSQKFLMQEINRLLYKKHTGDTVEFDIRPSEQL